MRRAILLLTTMALALVAADGVALAFDCGAGSDTYVADFDVTVVTNCEEGVAGGF